MSEPIRVSERDAVYLRVLQYSTIYCIMDQVRRACTMGVELIPKDVRARFRFDERGHATAILRSDFAQEFNESLGALRAFTLRRSDILTPGGGRSPIPIAIDGSLGKVGWSPKSFDIKITIDEHPVPIPTHKIDNFKNRVGVEVEWNNKTEFYDRDLNNLRLLNVLNVLSVGVIITRVSELQRLFDELGKRSVLRCLHNALG